MLIPDRAAGTLTVRDNGIGMSRDELADNLGTIARSGTQRFVSELSGNSAKDLNLIGQFGVGFYSAFMVAGEVEVIARKAGEEHAWRWHSDGRSGFAIEAAADARAARHRGDPASARRRQGVPRRVAAAPDRAQLLRPHRGADPAPGRDQGGRRQG